ncbi:transposase, IS4 family protein [Alkaliphilus metalliredigens QYMF]|uniref:Transposase, IS4 family protein n=1 Tax=Alkaliphilus metalliredigens (strain QYMF) TaxID=293826 RepID=A6TSV1_ALKMQ|nr:IS1634 family transposase [Alkaliphilus metalliredigens]ABR49269.1 transposase, IS4 family protein [Alkaliphilus metalliredigens QYMF]
MGLVYVPNKTNGTTYVYDSTNYWDKEKKQSRSKRVCVGKLDENGNFIPSKRLMNPVVPQQAKQGPVPSTTVKHSYYGATYLFDAIGESLGITADLKRCFPEIYKQILSIAYFLILEDRNSLSRFPKWDKTHRHPFGNCIPSQRSSDIFHSITEEAKERFFHLQGKRRMENEYWAYDTTSISSYSESLKQVKYGVNKEHDPLRQINLALLFGQESGLPFYYRKLAGNISDVKTVKNLLADIDLLGLGKVKLVMDRGFYSEKNINALYQNHVKFLMATKVSLKFVQQELNKVRDNIRTRANYNATYQLYSHTTTTAWDYSQERPYKGDVIKDTRRMYLHIYFNGEKALEHENRFNAMLDILESELISGKRNSEHEKQYAKYFEIATTPVRGTTVTAKQDIISKAEKDYGFFALISNEIKDPIIALETYRNKDLVEKAFGNLKERLNLRRTAVSSESSLEGKLFVQFVALIYLSHIKKKMSEKELYQSYTMQELLDELDVIEAFENPGNALRVGEVTKKQEGLYTS